MPTASAREHEPLTVVSEWGQKKHSRFTILLTRGAHHNTRGAHHKHVQHLAGRARIQLTLDRYSHWMPSLGRNTATAMDVALEADEAITDEALRA
jgi:hypothetical protein